MRVYVAAKWEDRARARRVMSHLEERGHTITYDWTGSAELSPNQALLDVEGVTAAEALVVLAEEPRAWKGTYVEFGIALGIGIPIYIVGRHMAECIFTLCPSVTIVNSVADLFGHAD